MDCTGQEDFDPFIAENSRFAALGARKMRRSGLDPREKQGAVD